MGELEWHHAQAIHAIRGKLDNPISQYWIEIETEGFLTYLGPVETEEVHKLEEKKCSENDRGGGD